MEKFSIHFLLHQTEFYWQKSILVFLFSVVLLIFCWYHINVVIGLYFFIIFIVRIFSCIDSLYECNTSPFSMYTTVRDNRHTRENSSEVYMRVVLHREELSKKDGKSPFSETAPNKNTMPWATQSNWEAVLALSWRWEQMTFRGPFQFRLVFDT